MSDEDKKLLARLSVLAEKLREVHAQEHDLIEEMRRLLAGEPGIADLVKRLEAQFDEVWCAKYAPGETGRYVWSFQRDRANLKRLVKTIGVDEIERRVVGFLANDEPFYVRARHNFAMFVATINAHAAQALTRSVTSNCPHMPQCSSTTGCTRKILADLRADRSASLL